MAESSTAGAPAKRRRASGRQASAAPTGADAVSAAAAVLADSSPLFFSLSRAEFRDPVRVTRMMTVVWPVQCLRSKEALFERILKGIMYKPYTPTAEDVGGVSAAPAGAKRRAGAGKRDRDGGATSSRVANGSGRAAGAHEEVEEDPYVVVHVHSIEPHADTARQMNALGDLFIDVMVTHTVARVSHGVLCGPCTASPFKDCVQVVVPCVRSDGAPAPATTTAGDDSDAEADDAERKLGPHKMFITVRCLETEPVVAGQTVFVVSEPGGSIRCLAIRPPRPAPGPFRILSAKEAADAERRAGGKRKGAADRGGSGTASAAFQIMCDLPPKEEGAEEAGRGKHAQKERA